MGATALLAAYVGVWATVAPRGFYESFPGFGFTWISIDGPFNEHLIRDVGAMYVALGTLTVAAFFARMAAAGRLVGLGWTVFGCLHFGYHALHPEGGTTDRIATLLSLGISLALGILLMIPPRRESERPPTAESGFPARGATGPVR
ncbi:hypothetical protein E6C64_03485 [Naasia lichenicola]|uniref:DoxX family protein n=1 Tax=Naasia lichenicola TaxID=2565933 RepID=A0A4S4FSG6_9MICO|nr:hypothetical protein E6C64_03485 [Naasia lichenicola]